MPAESKSLSEFPRALEVLSGALLLISNPSGQDSFDTNSALLTEVAQAMLNVHYTQELGDVSVFDAIKNARVLSGTTTPTSAEGVDGQLYIKYETTGGADEVVAMYFKKSSAWLEISLGGGGNTDYIECTQAQYDAWEQGGTLDPDTLYFITDGNIGNDIIDDSTTSATTVWSSDKTDTEIQAVAITPSAVSFTSNTKLTSNGVEFIKYGKFILMLGVFRGTTLNANETIFQLNNVNLITSSNTPFIPISGNFGSNYVGYLKAENSGTGIKIFTDVALDNPSLIFVNGILPIK